MPDSTGIVFASIVWIAILFAAASLAYMAIFDYIWYVHAIVIGTLMFMALWSHLMIIFTDPGAIPANAHPITEETTGGITMCGRCDGYKPPKSHHGESASGGISVAYFTMHFTVFKLISLTHHLYIIICLDRFSNRCISRMDHFCPWTNNAIGAKNQKHFFLFLIYVDVSSVYFYILIVIHMVRITP